MAKRKTTKKTTKKRRQVKWPRTLTEVARALERPRKTVEGWRDAGAPINEGEPHDERQLQAILDWHENWIASKKTVMARSPQNLVDAKLDADLKYRLAKARREQIRLAKEEREYADLAFGVLADHIETWKMQTESWIDQIVLLVAEDRRAHAKGMMVKKLDQLYRDMAKSLSSRKKRDS